MPDALQKHMSGNNQATIENNIQAKEIAVNETLLQLVYKHLDGITIDTVPFASRLSSTTPGDSGADGIGVDSSSFSTLSSATDQGLWSEADAQLTAIFNASYIKADGSTPYTGNLRLDNQDLLITASSNQSQGQSPLTAPVNIVTVVVSNGDVVTLPSPSDFSDNAPGAFLYLKNADAGQSLDVYPSSGVGIDILAPNNTISIASGEGVIFMVYSSTRWYTF